MVCSRTQELLTAITTLTFDEAYLTITANVVVLGKMAWAQQLFSNECSSATLGPFADGDANVWTTKNLVGGLFLFMKLLLGSNLTVSQMYQLGVPALI
jgi:hypothetical protein